MEYSKGNQWNLLMSEAFNMRFLVCVLTLGKTSSRTSKARLEFQPEYPRMIMSAYICHHANINYMHPVN